MTLKTTASDSTVLVDDSLVRHLLTLTPEERIDSHESARALAKDLAEAGREHYVRQSKRPAQKTAGK
jgi:hypothetical protein